MKILIRVSYLGTNYAGFQVQKNAVTVQEKLQDAVESLYGVRYPLTGCSRTDSGVHAKDFCCTIEAGADCERIPFEKIPDALNVRLPKDISVFEAFLMPDDFHPRYSVHFKEYEYLIYNSRKRSPFYEGRAFQYPTELDEFKMDRAADMFRGTHDFSAFMSSGSGVSDTVRTVKYCRATRNGREVRVTVAADGFLYNMVRIIVGTLIEVSAGKIQEQDIPVIIESKERGRSGFTAPPEGLYLNKVVYR
ncbi:MAG: tRNA pseudouridine(38-40) synthase TruA [Firmicutes bacterium]|nr:tRNA pseudouridine(38-40) synthase TruA [Bacillota bacterium]